MIFQSQASWTMTFTDKIGMTFRSQFAQSLVDLHTQSEVDPGEVTEGQGKEVANETKSSKIVFCHFEILRSAPSRLTSSHLTQLAAVSTPSGPSCPG